MPKVTEVQPGLDPGLLAPVPEYFHCTRLFYSPFPWATLTWDGHEKPSHSYKVREIGRRLAEGRGHCGEREKVDSGRETKV